MPKFKTTMEIEIEVEYSIEPAQKGRCDSLGVPEEPSWKAYPCEIDLTYPTFEELEPAEKEIITYGCEADMIEDE